MRRRTLASVISGMILTVCCSSGCPGDDPLDDDDTTHHECGDCDRAFDDIQDETLDGIRYCTEVLTQVTIGDKPLVTEVDLPCLERIVELFISGDHVSRVHLPSLLTVVGDLSIQWCPQLTDQGDLQRVESVGGSLVLSRNSQMARLEIPSLTVVGHHLDISNNDSLTQINLPSLLAVAEELHMSWDGALTEITGLGSLEHVGRELEINHNDALERIEFPSLVTVEGDLFVGHNDSLTDLSGLDALESVGGELQIRYNACISQVEAEAFAAGVAVGGHVSVHGNEGPCR